MILEIEDRGKGFPSGVLENNGNGLSAELGVGLRGMNERIRQLGGRIEVVSPGNGTLVRAVVPPGKRQTPRNDNVAVRTEEYAVTE